MKKKFIITVKMPKDVSVTEMMGYIKQAISKWHRRANHLYKLRKKHVNVDYSYQKEKK